MFYSVIVKIRILHTGPRYVLHRTSQILPPPTSQLILQLNLTHLPSFLLPPLTPPCSSLPLSMMLLILVSPPISVTCRRHPQCSCATFAFVTNLLLPAREPSSALSHAAFPFIMSLLALAPSLSRTMTMQPLIDRGSAAQNCKNLYFNWNGDEIILDRNNDGDNDQDNNQLQDMESKMTHGSLIAGHESYTAQIICNNQLQNIWRKKQ